MGDILGQFELVTMLAVLQRGNNAYGGEIQEYLMENASRDVTLGAIHRTLQRLEEKGLVESRLADEEADRIRRPRRYFKITGNGIRAVNESHGVMNRLFRGLNPVLEGR